MTAFRWLPQPGAVLPPQQEGYRFVVLAELGDIAAIRKWFAASDAVIVSHALDPQSAPAGVVEDNRFVGSFLAMSDADVLIGALAKLYVRIPDNDRDEVELRLSV